MSMVTDFTPNPNQQDKKMDSVCGTRGEGVWDQGSDIDGKPKQNHVLLTPGWPAVVIGC